MAKIDYDNLTKQIVEYVGGVENIKTITHCVTRLRLYLNDRNKAEDEKIKNLPGVLGVVYGNQQYQIILGEHLFPVFDNLEKNYSVQTEAAGLRKPNWLGRSWACGTSRTSAGACC